MQVETHCADQDGVAVIVPHGDLDLTSQRTMFQTTDGLTLEGRIHLAVDLLHTEFVDSAGLATLIAIRRKCQVFGGRFAIVCEHPRFLGVFRVTRLDKVFHVFPDRSTALSFLAYGQESLAG